MYVQCVPRREHGLISLERQNGNAAYIIVLFIIRILREVKMHHASNIQGF